MCACVCVGLCVCARVGLCVCARAWVCALVPRSQFALKFLDPSFVPITNSLTHELQEKPSKWAFNRTAFAHQR